MKHNNEYNYKCGECDKKFIQLINYKSHLKMHNK